MQILTITLKGHYIYIYILIGLGDTQKYLLFIIFYSYTKNSKFHNFHIIFIL
jgi:hypothetical protein